MLRGRVTLTQVAEAAGVSVGTASKALNGRGQLSPATRKRVRDAARALGFDQGTSESLTGGRSLIVGVLSTDSYGRFTIPILTGAEDTFGAGEIAMLLAESRGDPIRERHYVQTLRSRKVDGIIVTGRSSDARASLTSLIDVPTVYALSPSTDPNDISVVPDDAGGATRAVEHLVSTGRSSIAVVVGPSRHLASAHRVAGALAALEGSGARLAGGQALYGEWSERWGYEAAGRLLAAGPFDGVFCASDQIARGVLECLRDHSVSVPAQVGVVGMDNWTVIAEAARPSITSVDLNLRAVGRRAAELLVRTIMGDDVPGGIEYVDCSLVARQSA
ncbi:MAG: hypothetical protein BGO96_10855 [Micrococcales bacterium 73-15]|uniref:LacI family DNA-binding transcriptional regulator n=1 Tax=Salana multivorans TaxID=120377 RepID=UPI0009591A59|nr:LacI family DNA-binding transcriptional regulator [Salana multivorans]OJX95338.1 MAG: hypothetical protein BGO96_10855 [Micrococcales bacterium 73-15]